MGRVADGYVAAGRVLHVHCAMWTNFLRDQNPSKQVYRYQAWPYVFKFIAHIFGVLLLYKCNMLDASKTIIITAGNARHVQMNTPKYRKLKVITCKHI